jgi:hypothetical protein
VHVTNAAYGGLGDRLTATPGPRKSVLPLLSELVEIQVRFWPFCQPSLEPPPPHLTHLLPPSSRPSRLPLRPLRAAAP